MKLVYIIILSIIWISIAGLKFDIQSIFCAVFSVILTFIVTLQLNLSPKKNYFKLNSISYCIWLAKEILMSSIAVSRIAWSKEIHTIDSFQEIQSIQENNIGIITYANSITLTPGTVTLYINDSLLWVHALDSIFAKDLQSSIMDNKIYHMITI